MGPHSDDTLHCLLSSCKQLEHFSGQFPTKCSKSQFFDTLSPLIHRLRFFFKILAMPFSLAKGEGIPKLCHFNVGYSTILRSLHYYKISIRRSQYKVSEIILKKYLLVANLIIIQFILTISKRPKINQIYQKINKWLVNKFC